MTIFIMPHDVSLPKKKKKKKKRKRKKRMKLVKKKKNVHKSTHRYFIFNKTR